MDSSLFEFYFEQVLVRLIEHQCIMQLRVGLLLDYRLIEYANRLPVRLHYHSNSGKIY